MTLAVAAKFGISSSYDIVYQVTGELQPTVIRGIGMGFSSLIGETFNSVMPYIVYSAGVYQMLPMIILGILSIIGGICTLFLPETKDKPMPQTIEDGEILAPAGWPALHANVARLRRAFVRKS